MNEISRTIAVPACERRDCEGWLVPGRKLTRSGARLANDESTAEATADATVCAVSPR